jgi:hypothetical protein
MDEGILVHSRAKILKIHNASCLPHVGEKDKHVLTLRLRLSKNLDFDANSADAKRFSQILNTLTYLLGDGKRKKIRGHEAIGLALFVDSLWDDARVSVSPGNAVASGGSRRATKSGGAEHTEPLYTDGPRLYYQSMGPLAANWQLRQILLNGNEDTPADIPAGRFRTRGLSPDDTEFLALSHDERSTVWTIPLENGSPRRIGDLAADDIAWSHDGERFAYSKGNRLFLAESNGTSFHLVATVPDSSGAIDHVRWSPDDRRIRFTLSGPIFERGMQAIWEAGTDGGNLRQLHFWPGDPMECCGDWTPDGRYFVFSSRREGIFNLWIREETSDWWRRPHRDPVHVLDRRTCQLEQP